MFLTISVSRVSAFVPKLYTRHTRINFLAEKKAFGSKVEVLPKYLVTMEPLVASLFGENQCWTVFRAV